ncbi:hypothetical protein LCGC14_0970270 [marine sediment metagenome]|uniref:Uncharacterized protein n=1 Tax=marine sediment metagenome TaxID=412755 RepID=A0A0F9NGE2_9ZZZZ
MEKEEIKKADCNNCKKEGRTFEGVAYFRKTKGDYRCTKCGNEFVLGLEKFEEAKIKMPKEKAKEEWRKYVELLKRRKEKYFETMKKAHYELKQGRELIDVYKIMKEAGLNDLNEPKLAIARADISELVFKRRDEGTGNFEMEQGWNRKDWKTDIELPQNTFSIHWKRETNKGVESQWRLDKEKITTKVPIIPVELVPEGDLKNYYILWEPSEWQELPETKDPVLLKRISQNLFVILGSWDLTELEQSIILGR